MRVDMGAVDDLAPICCRPSHECNVMLDLLIVLKAGLKCLTQVNTLEYRESTETKLRISISISNIYIYISVSVSASASRSVSVSASASRSISNIYIYIYMSMSVSVSVSVSISINASENCAISGLSDGLLPVRWQAITWTYAGTL